MVVLQPVFKESTMTTFVHAEYPAQHPGVIRAERTVETFKQVAADLQDPKGVLAALIQPLNLLARAVAQKWQSFVQARRAAQQDALMWEIAQQDPRLMAEIQRALAQGNEKH
jgi:hypothetical protein